MTAARLSPTTLATSPRANLLALLDTRSKVADPVDPSGVRKFVYSREPDVNKQGFAGFPYIILPGTTFVPSKQTVDRKSAQQDFTCEIEVVTCDRGRGDADGQGQVQLDSITNDVLHTLMDRTNRGTLSRSGIYFMASAAQPPVVEPFKDTLVYRRSFAVSFRTRMPVST